MAQKKKAGIVVGLVAVTLLLWGRLLLKEVPRTATARPSIAATTPAPAGGEPVQRVAGQQIIRLDLPQSPSRNLFELDPSRYKRTKLLDSENEAGKSRPLSVDHDQRLAEIREAASHLMLHSTVPGEQPYAVINGMVVRIGEQLDGFRLIGVEHRTVILEYEGVPFRLRM
jgi:hypothetical protein